MIILADVYCGSFALPASICPQPAAAQISVAQLFDWSGLRKRPLAALLWPLFCGACFDPVACSRYLLELYLIGSFVVMTPCRGPARSLGARRPQGSLSSVSQSLLCAYTCHHLRYAALTTFTPRRVFGAVCSCKKSPAPKGTTTSSQNLCR